MVIYSLDYQGDLKEMKSLKVDAGMSSNSQNYSWISPETTEKTKHQFVKRVGCLRRAGLI